MGELMATVEDGVMIMSASATTGMNQNCQHDLPDLSRYDLFQECFDSELSKFPTPLKATEIALIRSLSPINVVGPQLRGFTSHHEVWCRLIPWKVVHKDCREQWLWWYIKDCQKQWLWWCTKDCQRNDFDGA